MLSSVSDLRNLCCDRARAEGLSNRQIKNMLKATLAFPGHHLEDPHFGELARSLVPQLNSEPFEHPILGDAEPHVAASQTELTHLPGVEKVLLLPNSQPGAGSPVGAVVQCRGIVMPSAVGSDLGCRMVLSILDLKPNQLGKHAVQVLHECTRFGLTATFLESCGHPVLKRDWSVFEILAQNLPLATRELGTSGSGNHFVELGLVELQEEAWPALSAGSYVGLLSHSGSRSMGRILYEKACMLAGIYRTVDRKKESDHIYFPTDSDAGARYLWPVRVPGGGVISPELSIEHR